MRSVRHLAALATVVVLLTAAAAQAQTDRPRIGISAAPDSYVPTIEVSDDEIFTLYACVLGPEDGTALDQPLSEVQWVIHQVCCGARIILHDIEFNPAYTHEGHPLIGVRSTFDGCLDADRILLATLQVSLDDVSVGDMLWAAGPFGPALDCEGGLPGFTSLPVNILYDGIPTPDETTSWGTVKSLYR